MRKEREELVVSIIHELLIIIVLYDRLTYQIITSTTFLCSFLHFVMFSASFFLKAA